MSDKTVVLIIDDEIHIINALKRVLHRTDYELIASTQPEEAINILDSTKCDIIICDYNMPIISGIDVLKHARKVMPNAVRILMTGCSDANIAISAINEGSVFYYISKPWKNEEVISVIQNAFEKKRKQKERNDLYHYLNDSRSYLAEVADKLKAVDKMNEPKDTKFPVLEDDNILLINSSDILYLTATEGDVIIFTKSGEYRSHDSLNLWSKRLGESRFFRCHRSYIVNIENIEKISPWFNGTYNINLRNCKFNIPVSRVNMKALRKLFGI